MILTEIEKFVIQSLFERQLISEEKLCNAIKTLPDPDLLNEFLTRCFFLFNNHIFIIFIDSH